MANAKTAGRAAEHQSSSSGSDAEAFKASGTEAIATAVGAGDLGAAASATTTQVQATAASLGDQVRQQAWQQVTTQKDRAAGGLALAADLLRQASQQVQDQEQPAVAQAITGVADRADRWSDALKQQDVPQLVDETKQFAQRQPGLFVGGALALGFLGVRFLKSSPAAPAAQEGDRADAGTSASSSPSRESDLLPDERAADASSAYPEAATFDAEEAELEGIPFAMRDEPASAEDR